MIIQHTGRILFNNIAKATKIYSQFHPDKFIYHCSESECSYGTNYFTNLKVHKNSRHEKINQTCDQCGYKTLWRSVLLRHLREEHGAVVYESKNISKEQILCANCGYSSFSKLRFLRHKCDTKETDGSSGECQVRVKSQNYSELDIGGRETC